jgi:hypothetical protein
MISTPSLFISLTSDSNRDGLGDITSRHPELDVDFDTERSDLDAHLFFVDKPGAQVILDLIQSRTERTITYIALGPLTNLAIATRLNGPAIRDKLGRVVRIKSNSYLQVNVIANPP